MFSFLQKKIPKSTEVYFGLLLAEESGVGYLLEVDNANQKVLIIDQKTFEYANSWEHLIEDVDEVLYGLEQKNKKKVKDIVFFVYSHLYDFNTNEIHKSYFEKIKTITSEMDLKSYGFILVHDAIAAYLKLKEQSPLNAILIELDTPTVTTLVYRAGSLSYSKSIAKTTDVTSDLDSIFSQAHKTSILPARIVVYDSKSTSTDLENIISNKWDENLFIQIPRVDVLTTQEVGNAAVADFSNELFNTQSFSPVVQSSPDLNEVASSAQDDSNMGFVVGKDITDEEEVVQDAYINSPIVQPLNDISSSNRQDNSGIFNSFTKRVRASKFPLDFMKKWPLPPVASIVVALLFLFLLGTTGALYAFHKADLSILIRQEKQKKEITINADTGTSVGDGELQLAKQKNQLEIEETIETSGEKQIGEKSQGSLTLLNKDKLERTFKKGTLLQTKKGIKFVLNEDVKVASASESITGDGNVLTVTGKGKGKAVAEAIGTSGNITKDEKLTIENISESLAFATADTAFAGGTQKDVQTVSKEDIENLEKKTLDSLKKSAAEKLSKSNELKFINELSEVSLSKQVYSKEVGEEAASASLKAQGDIVLYGYNPSELQDIILKEFTGVIEDTYEIPKDAVTYTVSSTKKNDDKIALVIDATVGLRKKVDEKKIKSALKGKNKSALTKILKDELKVDGYLLNVKTFIPFLKNTVPFFEKNISLKIDSL